MEMVTLAAVINARLAELGWNLKRASAETGISYRHIIRIVRDERYRPQRTTIDKLASVLEIPRSTLLLSIYQQEMSLPEPAHERLVGATA